MLINPYIWILKFRETLYRKGILKRCRPDVFTVSVGNLSMGGTGKTPTVLELAKFFRRKGLKTAILLRGYGRKSKGPLLVSDGKRTFLSVFEAGDEAFLYAQLIKGVAVAVAEKRCKGWQLLKTYKPDILLLDDAFQHTAIERDFDIVLLTPNDLKSKVFPFGRLREPLSAVWRADYCLLSKTEKSEPLENLCRKFNKKYGYLKLEGFQLYTPQMEKVDFETLRGKKVGIVSAVGDNKAFQKQVKDLSKKYGFLIEEILEFRDHFDYRNVDLNPNLIWITTFKDLFKLKDKNIKLLVLERKFQLPGELLNTLYNLYRKRKEKS